MRFITIIVFLSTNLFIPIVSNGLKTKSNEVFCEDVCTDGHKCLTNEWFVCKWKQILIPETVCCLQGSKSSHKSMNSVDSYVNTLQTNCPNRRLKQFFTKRSLHQFWQSLTSGLRPHSTERQTFPWMVSVLSFGRHICGGALITRSVVITAAHCFAPLFDSSVYSIRIGSNRLSEGQELSITHIILHELYFASESYHDIALIIIKSVLRFDEKVDIVCLPRPDTRAYHLIGLKTTTVGFGHNYYNGFLSQTLKQIKNRVISNEECAHRYVKGDRHNIPVGIQDCMICAIPEGADVCQGDSGGPMTATINGVNYLIGIVSFGRKCGTIDIPGVYTNVTYYLQWIFGQLAKIDNKYSK